MASQSMADYLKTAGWLVLVGWWLTPIISLLVNKLFAYLFSDVSRKFRNLETITVPDLKQALSDVLDQRMRRSVEGKGSRDDLKTLAKLEEDLKSAFYEAQDIMDIVDYHRAEEEAVGHASSWVQQRLAAAGACIALCFRRSWVWLWPWIDVTRGRAAALRRFIIHGLLSKMHNAIQTARAMLQQCAQCLCHQHLLPVSVQTPDSGSRGSMVGQGTSSLTPPTALEATAGVAEELDGPKPPLLKLLAKKLEEEKKEAEKGAPWRCIRQCFQSMLILSANAIAFLHFYRDWSYEVVGIESNQSDGIAVYYFFPPFGASSLSKRIEHIENILDDSKKSYLLDQQSSRSEIPNKGQTSSSSNERSGSEITSKDTKKESSRRQEQIDDWYRKIERKVFGRDKECEHICEMFRERSDSYGTASSSSCKPYSVFGIHGIAGSGKSTLANYICDHEKKAEDKHFNLIMFSHVSVTFRVEKIFRDMLREITGIQSDKDIESLGKELMEKLKGRRFLLVLDDLWVKGENQKEREILLDALGAGENGSVILVTAQKEDAAKALGAREKEQMLMPDLEEEEYLSLFMHHALQGTVDDAGRFEWFGRTIAKKLQRSPIAAVAVGRRLQIEKNINFWKDTAENHDVLNDTMGALWWSYQQLCGDTRRCFQYCSVFPKGYRLKRDELVRIWIAQGFINTTSNGTEELEDVAQWYLEELLRFSFLQANDYDKERFTIHDLLHELAERAAGSDFFRIDDLSGLPAKDILLGVRHLFVGSQNVAQAAQTVEKNLDLGNLRTLIIDETNTSTNRKQRRHDLEKTFDRLFKRLRKLRVLIIRLGSNPEELSFPGSIEQMKHLRYLVCRSLNNYDGTLILPSIFNKFYQMHAMFFYLGTSVSYPHGMGNLIRMRHIQHVFPNIGRMTSLQTMHYFSVKKEQGYELKQLKHLNKLRGHLEIFGLGNVGSKEEAFEANLASKKRVTDLELYFFDGRTKNPDIEAEVLEGLCPPKELQALTIRGYRGSRYPSWMLSGQQHPDAPKHLRRLELMHCSSPLASFPEDSELFMHLHELFIRGWEQDSFPENMQRLVSLQILDIVGCGHSKSTMVLGPTLPRSLRKILIYESNLVLENMEHLVSLESLDIHGCDKMEVLPTLPQSLKKIGISQCNVLSRTCQEEGHENWQKIQHIGRRYISSAEKETIVE
ncbi:hypothetical protein BS78_05G259900 [Paspalum vaginatum]|nr:hypothetical protein BS78_05G259900 [Paspalum vaginatum]